jgi:hypothetical protein
MASFRLTRGAIEDLDAIWLHIYNDDPKAADAVEEEIRSACALLAESPLQGHLRRDLTKLFAFGPFPSTQTTWWFTIPMQDRSRFCVSCTVCAISSGYSNPEGFRHRWQTVSVIEKHDNHQDRSAKVRRLLLNDATEPPKVEPRPVPKITLFETEPSLVCR